MFSPGSPVRVAMSKYGGAPHWTYDMRWLGRDEFGDWLGAPAGTHHARPGLSFDSDVDSVVLVDPTSSSLSGLHAPGLWCDIYVDIATPPRWGLADGSVPVVRSIDLDLDVIRRSDGTVFIDDEDEFAEHRVTLGYPDALCAAARDACTQIRAAVVERRAPYDDVTAERWLARLASLGPLVPPTSPGPNDGIRG